MASRTTFASMTILPTLTIFTLLCEANTPMIWCHFPVRGWNMTTRPWSRQWVLPFCSEFPQVSETSNFPLDEKWRFSESSVSSVRGHPWHLTLSFDLVFSATTAKTFFAWGKPTPVVFHIATQRCTRWQYHASPPLSDMLVKSRVFLTPAFQSSIRSQT